MCFGSVQRAYGPVTNVMSEMPLHGDSMAMDFDEMRAITTID
jgi:hypothetical protein